MTKKTLMLSVVFLGSGLASVLAASYPDMRNIVEPTTQYPASFSAFNPPIDPRMPIDPNAPQIAEWTRQNQPGDTMALTAEGIDGDMVHFVFYSKDSTEAGLIQRADGRTAAVTLPDTLTPDDYYLMWPMNEHGFGEPVGINQTELWWIGFDVVSAGEIFYAYGRNLLLGDGDCSLYITELDRWLTSTTNSNPYKAEFTMPQDVPNGTYTVYAHNGHGLKYGWSEAKTIMVVSPTVWNGKTYNIATDFGANGSDELDDQAAFSACQTACASNPRSTVYIPAGTYNLSGSFTFSSNTRYIGAGVSNTIITATASRASGALITSGSNFQVQDLTIMPTKSVSFDKAIYFQQAGGTLKNVRFADMGGNSTHGFVNLSNSKRMRFENCTFISGKDILCGGASQLRFDGCSFLGVYDNNQVMTFNGTQRYDISSCMVGNYDSSDASEGFGWAKGRWIVDTGASYGGYIGDNETVDMLPRTPTPFFTSGVVTSFSALGAETNVNTLGACKTCIISFVDIPAGLNGRGNNSGIWWGGAVRLPIDPNDGNYADDYVSGYMKQMDATGNTATIWLQSSQWTKASRMSAESTVSAIMTDIVDANSGEQYLFEGTFVRYTGKPSSSTYSNTTFSGASGLLSIGSAAKCAYISSGPGIGQTRLISSVTDNGGGVAILNFSEPWRVLPTTNSVIVVGRLAHRNVFHSNIFDATPAATQAGVHSASAGIQPYGSASGLVIDGNTFTQIRRAVALFAYDSREYADTSRTTYNPIMFNHVANNTFSECYSSININESTGNLSYPMTDNDTGFVGNVFRGNTSSSNTYAAVGYACSSLFSLDLCKLNVFDGNTISATANAVIETGDLINQVWVGNNFSGEGGTGIKIAPEHIPALQGNSWSGFATDYGGVSSGGVLELPVRFGFASPLQQAFEVYNSGSASMSVTANGQTKTIPAESSASFHYTAINATNYVVSAGNDSMTFHVLAPDKNPGRVVYSLPSSFLDKELKVSVVETMLKNDIEVPIPGKIPQIVDGSACLFRQGDELLLYISSDMFDLVPGRPYHWGILEQDGDRWIESIGGVFYY